ncbi:MAG: (2Fe-2S)-binding protein [Phycisphaerae bacterium]|nr:(2Fe-2S)-binding protein [Phycisphaerae bacterium]
MGSDKKLTINGREHVVPAPDGMPLLWVLRDLLKLRGTKFGCGKALCGACTVHLDGVAVRSCVLPVERAVGKSVRTIEGLGDERLHPLQDAWLDHQVSQCGYCQSGQLMAAASLLERNPNPTSAEIDAEMSGILCRCGTYPRIRAAILSVAEKMMRAAGADAS